MPNRTIYLPDDLDQLSRRLKLNLSQLTQEAIRRRATERSPQEIQAVVEAASKRAVALDLDWSTFSLADERESAGER